MRKTLLFLSFALASQVWAQPKDVTKKYLENPDFSARFAAWVNPGKFTYNVSSSFEGKSGEVWMEKWVAKGSTLGTNEGIYQSLNGLPNGTYTLVASAKNTSQSSVEKQCKGAILYAGQEQVEIHQFGDYSVTFTVANGKARVGVKLQNCDGNWVCVDNFRLFYNGENADSLATEQTRLDAELKALHDKVDNANKTSLKVTTYDFVPTGNTIALGRATFSGSCKEKGYCWSTEGDPTIFDDTTTETFSNNGDIYVMRGLKPATVYYVRPYAMTTGGYVAYGQTKKIVTLPAGNMTYSYDKAGDAETNARINSASAECVWMYNNLSYIPGFFLQVHYVPGAGAGGGTADCSYGGWMRVSQNVPYQQTGTMLHETNHGVGVGTTGEWYNNSNLRAETSRGLWLGPMGTKMVRFFENSATATMTGDNTHMWPYGINGAHEDSYQPSNQCLYYANILITHALHQDGLPSTSGVGFASPAYVFEQRDTTKYYIKSNNVETGMMTGYLHGGSTSLKWDKVSSVEAKADDAYAWYIKYDPKTRLYYFQNVGSGRMITYNNGYKMVARSAATDAEKLHLMPARVNTIIGSSTKKLEKTAYWVMKPGKYSSQAMEATTSGVTAKTIDLTNAATRQQWLFLTEDELEKVDAAAVKTLTSEAKAWITNLRATLATPHHATSDEDLVSEVDAPVEDYLTALEADITNFTMPNQFNAAIDSLKVLLVDFLAQATPDGADQPFDLTYLLENPTFDKDNTGWSDAPIWDNKCLEYYEENFDFNQTTALKLPAATYEVRAQGFQRPSIFDDTYTAYVKNGSKNEVNVNLYIKTKSQKIKHICAEATEKNLGTGGIEFQGLGYVPANMQGAQAWFRKGLYDNSVMTTTSVTATIKLGLKSTANSSSGYWTCFDNFRLYCYGGMTADDITALNPVRQVTLPSSVVYDLQGRKVTAPVHGLYVKDGRKVLVK